MNTSEQLTITDTFGRLPDDVLKYMLLLNIPKITFEDIPYKTTIKIELPLLGIFYNFRLKNTWYDDELNEAVEYITKFNNDEISTLDLNDTRIDIDNQYIYLHDDYNTFKMSIKYLPLIKNATEEYLQLVKKMAGSI